MARSRLGTMMLLLTGCASPVTHQYQRFVLVPDPTKINAEIPPGALALDTQTGNVCFTMGGSFAKSEPGIESCWELESKHPNAK